ncbi:MAG: pentapeptide repeat-containing protein, partial [Candidatus Limivicinus sp.]
ENCTLAEAHLAHSNLTGARLKDCIVFGADLRNCCVENLSLEDTELEDAYTQGVMEKEQGWEQSCSTSMTMG